MHDGRGATATTREVRRALDNGGMRYSSRTRPAVMRASVKQHGANARDFVRPREGERGFKHQQAGL